MSTPFYTLEFSDASISLLPQKAIFIERTKTIILADLHLGKVNHFRKAGIIIPADAGVQKDYDRLHILIATYLPQRIIFLGDLFHSSQNGSWIHFMDFMKQHADIEMILIKGNHDILPKIFYDESGLMVIPDYLQESNIIYTHEPLESTPTNTLNIAGHIHPGAAVKGLGRQRIKLPCFYHKPPLLLLPAFGSLTGLHLLPDVDADRYIVIENSILKL